MNVAEAENIVGSGVGVYGDRYRDAMELLACENRDNPCPPELARTKEVEYKGFTLKIYYNYVPPFCLGDRPANCWFGYATNGTHHYKLPLNDDVKTLEDAFDVIWPHFVKYVERIIV